MKNLNALSLKVVIGMAVLACGGWSLSDLGWGNIIQAPQIETKKISYEEEEVDDFTLLVVDKQHSDSTDADGGCFDGICTTVNNGVNKLVNKAIYAKEWVTGELQERWTPPLVVALQMLPASGESVEKSVGTINYYLEQGADVNAVVNGKSALRFVTELAVTDKKFLPIMELLVNYGANPYVQEAVAQGSDQHAEFADADAQRVVTKNSDLHVAVAGNCLQCAELLVDAMVHPRSFVHKCIDGVCKLVWAQPTHLSVKDSDAITPLQMVVTAQEGIDLSMLKLLVDHKENLASWDKEEALWQAFLLGDQEAVKMLSGAGVANWAAILSSVQRQDVRQTWGEWFGDWYDYSIQKIYGKKRIDVSATVELCKSSEEIEDPATVRLCRLLQFVENGVLNPATTDSNTGNNLLHELVEQYGADSKRYEETATILFSQNKFSQEVLNTKNRAGKTVLEAAVYWRNTDFIKQLLEHAGCRITDEQIDTIQSELIKSSNRFSLLNSARREVQEILKNELTKRHSS